MASTTYSASRLGTFESCKLKYSLSYKRGYYAEETQQNVLTRKGVAFHYIAETYDPSWSQEKLDLFRLEVEQKYTLPEEFSLVKPVQKFQSFHKDVIEKALEAKSKVDKEIEFKFKIDSYNFTGKLDVLISNADGTFNILDYKTGKNANSASYYVGQMMLYVYALHQQYKIPIEDIANRITVALFFPLADSESDDYKKVLKKLTFTQEILNQEISRYKNLIVLAESNNWDEKEANLTKLCEFCPFIGRSQYCELSAKAGLLPTRGVIIKQRSWAMAQGIK